jgi:ketosteroid isomerase-like protein
MNSGDENIEIVGSCYELFLKGDLPGIMAMLHEDVDWATETTSTAAPWYGPRRGKAQVAAFFEAFDSTMEVEEFTPLVTAGSGQDVLTVVHGRFRHRASGRSVAMNLHHRFTLRDGLIAYHRAAEDTAQIAAVFQS